MIYFIIYFIDMAEKIEDRLLGFTGWAIGNDESDRYRDVFGLYTQILSDIPDDDLEGLEEALEEALDVLLDRLSRATYCVTVDRTDPEVETKFLICLSGIVEARKENKAQLIS
jgi:hypothetical protein